MQFFLLIIHPYFQHWVFYCMLVAFGFLYPFPAWGYIWHFHDTQYFLDLIFFLDYNPSTVY